MTAGAFRQDLYYRLNVFPITLPPLQARAQDIPALAEYFLRLHRGRRAVPGFTADALACLRTYPFPGNVRELENEVERRRPSPTTAAPWRRASPSARP